MPIRHLQMQPGRTPDPKRVFVSEATRVAVETLKHPPERVDIVITDVARDAWAKGGQLYADS